MKIQDSIAKRALSLFQQEVHEGRDYTKPWLDLDVEAYRAYRERERDVLPSPTPVGRKTR